MRKPKKTRAPKKPKQSAGVATWKSYDERYKAWEKREREKFSKYNSDKAKKASLIKKYAH